MDSWNLVFISTALLLGFVSSQDQYGSPLSSYSQHELWLRPFDWTYLRFEVPAWFSSVTMTFLSDTNIDRGHMSNFARSQLPVICLKDGNPPIPDLSDSYLDTLLSSFISNGSFFGDLNNSSHLEQCVPFQSNLTVILTDDQRSPGIWYVGYFNGLGPARTQSKMISRGKAYKITTNILTQGCPVSDMWGPQCSQSIHSLSCSSQSYTNLTNSISCSNSNNSSSTCLSQSESSKLYYLDIINTATQIKVSSNRSIQFQSNSSDIKLICYLRYNLVPSKDLNLYDYAVEIGAGDPLILNFPMIGKWYILIEPLNGSDLVLQNPICFSLGFELVGCVNGKAGLNCSWDSYMLERVPKKNPAIPFDSYYIPTVGPTDSSATFSLQNYLTNSSFKNPQPWTFFYLTVPHSSAGASISMQIKSIGENDNYELYSKFGALPSNDTWDYYSNGKKTSGNPIIFPLNGSEGTQSGANLEMFILYGREGTWYFGLKHPPTDEIKSWPLMYVSLVGCYKGCSGNGTCKYSVDESGLTFYSYCACDRDHGGFDCNDELVSPTGHMWQSISLVASNAAAILPALWALRQKAFAEWILFTASGVSSALYHACDVGTWCILSFHVLQFLDFWLSFMAVVSTFIFMATIDESSKRAIHAGVFILTALLAATGATRTRNIGIVIAIGTVGLLIGWLLEFTTTWRFMFLPRHVNFHLPQSCRCENISSFLWDLLEALRKRFRWGYLLLGFVFLAMAGTSWKQESNKNYWIWHSLWHITIYTSSFFFLCSTRTNTRNYELTRQDSSSRADLTEEI